jgi:hypothetical protein
MMGADKIAAEGCFSGQRRRYKPGFTELHKKLA